LASPSLPCFGRRLGSVSIAVERLILLRF